MNITIREKDGNFQAIVSYKQNGKWKQKSKQGFKLRKDAKNWANEMQYLIMEDKKDGIETNEMTVREALDIYLEFSKNTVKFSSFSVIKMRLKILEDIKDLVVSDIKPIQITTLIQNKQKSGHFYSNEISTIKAFFNFCIKELKVMRDNPVTIQKKKRKDTRIKYINEELYQKILSEQKDEDVILFIKMLYYTGMRISEVRGLKYTDIQNSIITVTRQIYKGVITDLKSENGYRQIPISREFYSEIKNIKIKNLDGFVFKNSNISGILRKYNVSPHCFRHTFATRLVANGYNLKVASEILGDKFETFINTYVQSSKEEKEKVFKQIIGI